VAAVRSRTLDYRYTDIQRKIRALIRAYLIRQSGVAFQGITTSAIPAKRRVSMKASISLAALLLAFAPGFYSSAQGQDTPKEHSMTGCLAKGDDAGTFKLTDLEQGPKVVMISETTANLTPHVGHKVQITGVAIPGKDKTHTMKVTAVKMISATCP
jgi:hypothetical protein